MIKYNFAVFILTHGRADNMLTLKTLERCGYTGKWYMVIDNEDKTADRYYELYGKDHVVMFDKLKKSKEFDTCDISDNRKAIVYARNACFDIAEDLGIDYFLELDDDYTEFRKRFWDGEKLSSYYVMDFDSICNEMIDFLEETKAKTVAFSQTGDFIGGTSCKVFREKLTRKAMNSFFCKTSNRFDFVGRINEDVNTYCGLGAKGELLFTIADISLNQQDSQQNKGGMTDLYLTAGTYVKSFYTVMTNPSFVTIAEMGCSHKRMHHLVDWEHGVPKIISDRFKIKD